MNISEILHYPNLDTSTVDSPSFDEGLYDTWENIYSNYHYDQVKPIPFDLETKVFQAGGKLAIFAFKNFNKEYKYSEQSPDIFLGMTHYYDGYKVNDVRVESSVRGQHYGMKLYLAFVDFYGNPIYSGSQQTTASNNAIWKKLITEYPSRVIGFDPISKKDLRLKVTTKGSVAGDNEPIYQTIPDKEFIENDQYYARAIKTRLLKLLPR